MDIAQRLRKENISEYILYLWQIEDLLRALQFSPEAVYSKLVAPRNADPQTSQVIFLWYMDIASLLRQEGKEQNGHLEHTLHLIGDLQNLHNQLMTLPAGKNYRPLVERLRPWLPVLEEKMGRGDVGEIELCFRTLYAAMLYKIKGQKEKQQVIGEVIESVSPVIGELSRMYGAVERGEVDLFKEE